LKIGHSMMPSGPIKKFEKFDSKRKKMRRSTTESRIRARRSKILKKRVSDVL